MGKKTLKAAAVAALTGTLLGNGCLGSDFWRQLLLGSAVYAGFEFVSDNDAVFDIFPDGGAAQ